MPKTRLDLLLIERGLAESRAKAQVLIMAEQVRVNGVGGGRVSIRLHYRSGYSTIAVRS